MKQKPGFNRIFRSLFSLSAITLFTITACTEPDEEVGSELFIRNGTTYTVNIKTFDIDFDRNKPIDDIHLKSGERWYEGIYGEGGPVGGFAYDSALFTFDDTLQVSFTRLECFEDSIMGIVNILCSSSWKSIDPSEGYDHASEYVVREEVYELAE